MSSEQQGQMGKVTLTKLTLKLASECAIMSCSRHITQLRTLSYPRSSCRNYILIRLYTTHKDHLHASSSSQGSAASSLLSHKLNRLGTSSNADGDRVGPFQLGMIPPSTKKTKKWDELSRGGKVARTALRTSNLMVIFLGAGFSGLLVYALASELFAKNSPTVLYNDACERIKASPLVASYLYPPFTFHTHPPLTHRPRHRARHVNSVLTTDAAGREHLFLNFYIEGSDPSEITSASPEKSLPSVFGKLNPSLLTDLTIDDILESARRAREKIWNKGREAFAYLVGEPVSSLNHASSSTSTLVTSIDNVSAPVPSPPPWSLSGIFTRLTGRRRPISGNSSLHYVEKKYWKSGEVHVDLVKIKESDSDKAGQFVVRYIMISLPDSNNRNPVRLYVERTPDVSDHEGVIRWSS